MVGAAPWKHSPHKACSLPPRMRLAGKFSADLKKEKKEKIQDKKAVRGNRCTWGLLAQCQSIGPTGLQFSWDMTQERWELENATTTKQADCLGSDAENDPRVGQNSLAGLVSPSRDRRDRRDMATPSQEDKKEEEDTEEARKFHQMSHRDLHVRWELHSGITGT